MAAFAIFNRAIADSEADEDEQRDHQDELPRTIVFGGRGFDSETRVVDFVVRAGVRHA